MKYMEGSEHITKSVEVSDTTGFFTDAYRLSVIVNNLVSNAIKYRDGSKDESVLLVNASFSPPELRLTVRDNGIGIPPEYMPRIFEMFFRATERSEGAGLGLYIVKETVEKLRGQIEVESEVGNYTTFTVTLHNLKDFSEEAEKAQFAP